MAPSEQTVLATPQSTFPPFAVPRSAQNMTRSEIHSGIIKNTVRVTRIRLEFKELQKQLEVWKATQLSPQFHRVSVPAGVRLDGIRKDLTSQISLVKSRLKHAEDELVRLPELPSAVPHLVDLDAEIVEYTDQLRTWLESFMRLAVPQPKPSTSPEPNVMDMDEVKPKPSGPASLLANLEERIENLEELLNEAQAEIPSPHSVPQTSATYIEQAISAARSRPRGEETQEQATERNASVATVEADAAAGEKKVASLAEQIALLQIRNEAHEKHLMNLKEQRDQNGRLLETMQTQLLLFQEQKEARAKQLALLAEQLARFAANPRRTHAAVDDSVLAGVRTTVEAMIQGEVVPALKTIGTRYAAAVECRMASLEQAIQPAVDQTNEICRRAEAMEIKV
ncbi:hypothetical protein C8R45DRAFT_954032 [Mycena sanguinolenta]|nr:hypothetical protein C8R45DRAFT_954032 [Mycena sanguinolenta]